MNQSIEKINLHLFRSQVDFWISSNKKSNYGIYSFNELELKFCSTSLSFANPDFIKSSIMGQDVKQKIISGKLVAP